MTTKTILALAQAHRKEPSKVNYDALAGAVRALVGEAEKSERRAKMFAGIFSNYTIAMQAALIDAELKSQLEGMSWIFNTLAGPGLLPDVDVAKAMGGAQAWFDAKMEEDVARVALYAHQQPMAEPVQEVKCDCGRTHKLTAYGWASNEPVQEPVLYQYRWLNPGNNPNDHCEAEWTLVEPRNPHMDTVHDRIQELEAYRYDGKPVYEVRALYAAAPQAEPLTDDQIFELAEPFGAFQYGDAQGDKRKEFARAIEAFHGIKGLI